MSVIFKVIWLVKNFSNQSDHLTAITITWTPKKAECSTFFLLVPTQTNKQTKLTVFAALAELGNWDVSKKVYPPILSQSVSSFFAQISTHS